MEKICLDMYEMDRQEENLKGVVFMSKITEGETLEVKNLLSCRKLTYQSDLNTVVKEMQEYIKTKGAVCIDNPITGVFGVERDGRIDVEVLIPIDKYIVTNEEYRFKEEFKLVNAITVTHTGNPSTLQDSCDELNSYIIKHRYQPVTICYNRAEKREENVDELCIKVYIGLNPNIV